MESNSFELIGRVNYVDIQFKETGTIVTRTLLGKKRKNEEVFDSFAVTIFGDLAENYAEVVKKGDYVYIKGRISVNKYTKDGKEVEKLELVGYDFEKVTYDVDAKQYIVSDDKAQSDDAKKETKTTSKVISKAKASTSGDDRPWH